MYAEPAIQISWILQKVDNACTICLSENPKYFWKLDFANLNNAAWQLQDSVKPMNALSLTNTMVEISLPILQLTNCAKQIWKRVGRPFSHFSNVNSFNRAV